MLRLIPPQPPLDAAESHALATLVDLSRLLVVEGQGSTGIELRVVEAPGPRTLADGRAHEWRIERRDGAVEVPRELLTLVCDIVAARREQRSSQADRFGRVPHSENALVQEGGDAERDPVINRVAIALRTAVVAVAERRPVVLCAPWPSGKRWAVAMSHDLDVVSAWPAFTALRIAELLGKRDFRRASRVARDAAGAALRDPVMAAVMGVILAERRLGLRSTWFIITGTPTFATMKAGDITYSPESPRSRRILGAATAAGHELGLHGSFATLEHPELFARQRDRLATLASHPIAGVRQHFLRMRPGATQRAMADAGFRYDSTFGFSDRNGFRLGVGDVVPMWDDATGETLDIDEVPFIWMDRALSKYRGIEDPNAWVDDALALAARCREVEGLWTGIWHPNLAPALGFPDAPRAFDNLCEGLMRESPWSATLGDIVQWRRGRRAARAIEAPGGGGWAGGGGGGGALRVRVPEGASALRLEDASGLPLPFSRA